MGIKGIVRKVDSMGRITLPAEMCKTLHIGKEDRVDIYLDDNKIIIKSVENDIREDRLNRIATIVFAQSLQNTVPGQLGVYGSHRIIVGHAALPNEIPEQVISKFKDTTKSYVADWNQLGGESYPFWAAPICAAGLVVGYIAGNDLRGGYVNCDYIVSCADLIGHLLVDEMR